MLKKYINCFLLFLIIQSITFQSATFSQTSILAFKNCDIYYDINIYNHLLQQSHCILFWDIILTQTPLCYLTILFNHYNKNICISPFYYLINHTQITQKHMRNINFAPYSPCFHVNLSTAILIKHPISRYNSI